MFNYEHETNQIKDRFLKNYIFYDYFHDSLITKISILEHGQKVQFELSCEREWPEHNWTKYADDNRYKYKMQFENCKYMEYERTNIGTYAEYINGRFKNSAKLKSLNRESRQKHYHLRIQLADGFVDLIFNKFSIEKIDGSINLPKRISLNWHFDWVKHRFKNIHLDNIIDLSINGEFPLKSYAIELLWLLKYDNIEKLAINSLQDEDAVIPSVFILGEIGKYDNLKYLINLLKNIDDNLMKRHVMDAIEKILAK